METVHLLNPFQDVNGGSEWHALSLFEELAEVTDVNLWSEVFVPSAFLGTYPMRKIGDGQSPKGGNIVLVGAYFGIGSWLRRAEPNRIIIIYNIVEPSRLHKLLEALAKVEGLPRPEVVFVSDFLRRLTPEVEGPVSHSPIDLSRFTPGESIDRPFTVGKHSRDDIRKHDLRDLPMYSRLVDHGMRVRLMGGHCLVENGDVPPELAPKVEFIPSGTEAAEQFLSTLDVFYFRNDPILPEAWGRAVMEALSTGIPVVAGREGGYADVIRHGENGYLVDSAEEAEEIILGLRDDPALRARIGAAGRETVRELYSPEETRRQVEFYAGP